MMGVKENLDNILNDIDVLDGQAEAWRRIYEELMKTGPRVVLPFGIDDTGINQCLALIRLLQAKASAFDSLCEKPPHFTKPEAADFNARMFQEGANRVHGLALELKTIADNTLDEYADDEWVKESNRLLH